MLITCAQCAGVMGYILMFISSSYGQYHIFQLKVDNSKFSHFVNPTSSTSHFVNSHFVNSHFVNSHFVNIDQMGIDKVGIDEVGRSLNACSSLRSVCWGDGNAERWGLPANCRGPHGLKVRNVSQKKRSRVNACSSPALSVLYGVMGYILMFISSSCGQYHIFQLKVDNSKFSHFATPLRQLPTSSIPTLSTLTKCRYGDCQLTAARGLHGLKVRNASQKKRSRAKQRARLRCASTVRQTSLSYLVNQPKVENEVFTRTTRKHFQYKFKLYTIHKIQ